MITLEFNDDAARAALAHLSDGLADLTPVMQELGEFLTTSTKQRFGQGLAPDGTPWAPKSQATLDAYESRNDPIDLRPLFGPSNQLNQLIFAIATADSVEWGSPQIYSAVMQSGAAKGAFGTTSRGSPIPWGDIPARPFLGISEDDRTGILEIVGEYLDGLAGGG